MLGFLLTTNGKTNANKLCPQSSCAMWHFACLSSCSERSTYMHLTNHSYFNHEKYLTTPNWRIKMAKVLGSPGYISVNHLHSTCWNLVVMSVWYAFYYLEAISTLSCKLYPAQCIGTPNNTTAGISFWHHCQLQTVHTVLYSSAKMKSNSLLPRYSLLASSLLKSSDRLNSDMVPLSWPINILLVSSLYAIVEQAAGDERNNKTILLISNKKKITMLQSNSHLKLDL